MMNWKKGFILSIMLIMALVMMGVTTQAINFVADPGFEDSTTFVNNAKWFTSGNAVFEVVTEGIHSGNKAARLTSRKDSYASLKTAPIQIRKNRMYEYSAWVKVPNAIPSVRFSLYANVMFTDKSGNSVNKWIFITRPNNEPIFTTVNPNEWTEIKCRYTCEEGVPGSATVQFYVYEHTYGSVSSEIWLDDYSIKPVDASISGLEGVLTSASSDKSMKYTTNMSDVTTWSVTDINGQPLTNGININGSGVLYIPAGEYEEQEIIVSASGTDTGIGTTLYKTVTIGKNLTNIAIDSAFSDGEAGLRTKNGSPWFIWKAKVTNLGGSSDATFAVEDAGDNGKAGVITGRTHFADCLAQNITIQENRTYLYAMDIKASNANGINNTYDIRAIPSGQTAATALISGVTITPETWTTIQGEKKWSQTSSSKTEMMLYGYETVTSGGELSKTLRIDNFKVIPKYVPNSIEITGAASLMLPESGSTSVTLRATLKNQFGTTDEMTQTVKWSIKGAPSGVSIDEATGVLTLQSTAQSGQAITITATAEDHGVTIYKSANIMVKQFLTNETLNYIIGKALNMATLSSISEESANAITQNLMLPSVYEDTEYLGYMVSFEWDSDNESALSNSGTVTQNEFNEEPVKLTVTASLGEMKQTKTFSLTVAKLINMIKNGDFESGATGNWTVTQDNSAVLSVNTAYKNAGNYSASVSQRASASSGVEQAMAILKHNRMYYIEAYIKGAGSGELSLIQGEKSKVIAQNTLQNSGFTKIADVVAYKLTEGVTPYLLVRTSSTDDFYIDDVTVNDVTDVIESATNAVDNAENTRLADDIKKAKNLVNALPDCSRKTALLQRLSAITVKNENSESGTKSGGGGSGRTSVNLPNQAVTTDVEQEVEQQATLFADINTHWAKPDIEFLASKNLVRGNDNKQFLPESNVTRAEFAAMVIRALGIEPQAYSADFADVAQNAWYSGVVQTVYSNHIMTGDGKQFRPNDNITREEMTKIIILAYEWKTGKQANSIEVNFEDKTAFSDWSAEYIKKAVGMEFIKGMSETQFAPSAFSTRAQAAVMIKRLYQKVEG